jgi:hypothetical protein
LHPRLPVPFTSHFPTSIIVCEEFSGGEEKRWRSAVEREECGWRMEDGGGRMEEAGGRSEERGC